MKKKKVIKKLKHLLKVFGESNSWHRQKHSAITEEIRTLTDDRNEWQHKAKENLDAYYEVVKELDARKKAAEHNETVFKNNKDFQVKLIEVLDLCFGVMMLPLIGTHGDESEKKYFITITSPASIEDYANARDKATKLYYELKKRLVEESGDQYHKTGGLEIWGEDFKNQLSKLYEKYYPAGEENIRKQEFHISEYGKNCLGAKMPSVREAENHDPEKAKGL